MATQERMLVVIDPTAKQHVVLERIADIVDSLRTPPKVMVMAAVDYQDVDKSATNDELYRDGAWLQSLLAPLEAISADYSVHLSWSTEWADSILYMAQKFDATTILLPHPGTDGDKTLSDEFWYLLRNTPVRVGLMQGSKEPVDKPALMAMALDKDKYRDLNERILQFGKRVQGARNVELHLAHAYPDSMHYPDRSKLVENTGIPNENIHLKMGELEDILGETIREIDAGLVIIGATRRTGIRAAMRGRQLTRILKKIKHDLVVMV